ncbi:hypothetical protein ACWEGQ_31235 [Streptomyces seoulensis]
MPFAEDVAEQLPEEDREAWWDAVTDMQDDIAAEQQDFTTGGPADTAGPFAPDEHADSDDAGTRDIEDHDADPDDDGSMEPTGTGR